MRPNAPRLPVRTRVLLAVSAAAALSASCLKGDNRPTPGSAVVTVESSASTRQGFTTSDGWDVTIERLLAGVGDISLNNVPDNQSNSCNDYSQASYDRLFDFTQVGAPQKVGLVYGLGTCFVEYRLRSPSDNTLIENGAAPADVTAMRDQASDAYVMDARTTLRLVGHADRGGLTVRFDWAFRRSVSVSRCADAAGTGFVDAIGMKANSTATVRAIVEGEELFRDTPDDAAPLVFDRIASADANGDGSVTLDELALISVPPSDLGMGGAGGASPNAPGPPQNLEDLVYEWLYPRVTRVVGGGPCRPQGR